MSYCPYVPPLRRPPPPTHTHTGSIVAVIGVRLRGDPLEPSSALMPLDGGGGGIGDKLHKSVSIHSISNPSSAV